MSPFWLAGGFTIAGMAALGFGGGVLEILRPRLSPQRIETIAGLCLLAAFLSFGLGVWFALS